MKPLRKPLALTLCFLLLFALCALPAAAEGEFPEEIAVSFHLFYAKEYAGKQLKPIKIDDNEWSAINIDGEALFIYQPGPYPTASFNPYLDGERVMGWALLPLKYDYEKLYVGYSVISVIPASDQFYLPLATITAALDETFKDLLVYPICSNAEFAEGTTAPWPNQNAGNTVTAQPGAGGAEIALQPSWYNTSQHEFAPLASDDTTANPVWYRIPESVHEDDAWYLFDASGELVFDMLPSDGLFGVAQAEVTTEEGKKTGYVIVVPLTDEDGSYLYDMNGELVTVPYDPFVYDPVYYNTSVPVFLDGNVALTLREQPHVYYYPNGPSGSLKDEVASYYYSDKQFEFMFDLDDWNYNVSSVKLYAVTGLDADGKPTYDKNDPIRTLTRDDDCDYLDITCDVILIPDDSGGGEEVVIGEYTMCGFFYALPDDFDETTIQEDVYHCKNGDFAYIYEEYDEDAPATVTITLPTAPPAGMAVPVGKALSAWKVFGPVTWIEGPDEEVDTDDELQKGDVIKVSAAPGSSMTTAVTDSIFIEPVWADATDADPGCSKLSGSFSDNHLSCAVTAQSAGPVTLIAARYLGGRLDGLSLKTVMLRAGENQFAAAFPGFAEAGATYKLFAVKCRSFAPLCAAWAS